MENKVFKTARDLKKEMVNVAMPVMSGFYSDFVYDLEKVDAMGAKKWDSHFYWAVRKNGTHITTTCKELDELKENYGEDLKIIALVGRDTKKDTFEIIYERK